jgi:ribosome-associated translation inhibitor RaiA
MKTSVDVTFLHMPTSPALEAAIHKEVERLERLAPSLRRCEVTIAEPHRHQRQGRHFHIKLQAWVDGHDLVVSRDPGLDPAHEDVYVAVRDAFRALRRELSTLAEQLHERLA